MAKKRQFIPRLSDGTPESMQALPDLAGLMEGNDAAIPFPDTVLYPPLPSRDGRYWRWLLVAFASCCAAGGVAVGAFLWLINLPPNVDCQTISVQSSDRAQLYCAQAAAESGDLKDIVAGLELLGQWSPSHPLFGEVQPLVNQWSETALAAARNSLNKNDLEGAIALVNRIPRTSPTYETAQATIAGWRKQWNQGEAIYNKGRAALKQKDWATASEQILALSALENDFWRVQQVQALSRQMRQEKQAQRLFAQAKSTAEPGGLERLSGALRAASQIDRSTYTWQEAQPFMNSWSDMLLNVAIDKWYAAQLDEAITLGQRAALNPSREQVAQELIRLSQARKLALKTVSDWRASPQQLVGLYQAMLLVNQIPPTSRFYPQAQSSLDTWKLHLQDLSQIQIAQIVGSIHSRDALGLAIDKAAAVPANHPRRQQAQTLISHWRKESQRIEDRPYLTQAQQMVKMTDLDSLRSAIGLASQIPLGRVMRPEAQNWIYVWNYQIQVLEDQPRLDRAWGMANRGELSQAITEASLIKPDRALYEAAQGAIATWRARIEAIELAQLRARQEALAQQQVAPTLPLPTDAEDAADQPAVVAPTLSPEASPAPQWSAPPPAEPSSDAGTLPSRIETVPGDAPTETPQPAGSAAGPAPTPLQITPVEAPPPIQAPPPLAPAPAVAPSSVTPPPLETAPPNQG